MHDVIAFVTSHQGAAAIAPLHSASWHDVTRGQPICDVIYTRVV